MAGNQKVALNFGVNPDFYLERIMNDPDGVEYVDANIRSILNLDEFAEKIVRIKENPSSIKDILRELGNEGLYKEQLVVAAIRENTETYNLIPPELRTERVSETMNLYDTKENLSLTKEVSANEKKENTVDLAV